MSELRGATIDNFPNSPCKHLHQPHRYRVPPRVRIRPRPVSFGNPALGTYKGCVYTQHQPQRPSRHSHLVDAAEATDVEGAITSEQRLVAMVNVPPEQVPEGVLNVTRGHQSYLTHVRIVISEDESDAVEEDEEEQSDEQQTFHETHGGDAIGEHHQEEHSGATTDDTCRLPRARELSQRSLSYPPYSFRSSLVADESAARMEQHSSSRDPSLSVTRDPPFVTAMENAASILAADEMIFSQEPVSSSPNVPTTTAPAKVHDKESDMMLLRHNDCRAIGNDNQQQRPNRTYLILFELVSDEAANAFVEDLHGKPYTSLDDTQTCSVHHVVALQGEDGVSLMSPFFAPSTKKSSDGMEIVASASSGSVESDGCLTSATAGATATKTILASKSSPATNNNSSAEVQNCAVCLERMDFDSSRPDTCVLTTVCNHTFHLDCLVKWQDSPCPVCRYDHSGLNEALSECHVCGITENNYVCLICGVVSCGGATTSAATLTRLPSNDSRGPMKSNKPSSTHGVMGETSDSRLSSSHARQHYDETLHAYALDTETQHVFDFAGQGYVHRLLQNKDDGKLVEVNDPNNTTSQERSLSPGLSDAQEGEVVHRKLEGFASQYYTLLKSQLEQQRIYYEGRLQEIRREYGRCRRSSNNSNTIEARSKKSGSTTDLIAALKQERNQLAQRLMSLQGRHDKVSEDVVFLKSMNESLHANKEALKRQIEEAQRQRVEARNMIQQCLPLLEKKLSLLMIQLEESTMYETVEVPQSASCGDRKPAARA